MADSTKPISPPESEELTPPSSSASPPESLAAETLVRIQAVTDAALAHLSLDELERSLLFRIRELLCADIAMILLCTNSCEELQLHAISSVHGGFENQDYRNIAIPIGRGVGGQIAQARKPIIFDNLDDVQVLNPVLLENSILSLVGAPLLIQDRVIGVVYVGKTSRHGFGQEDARLLQLVAERFAIAIERSQLYNAVQQEEKRKSAILEAALDCIVIMDEQGIVTEFNPAAERTFGYQREEAIGKLLSDLIVPLPLRERYQSGLIGLLDGHQELLSGKRFEITGMRADGTEFPLEVGLVASKVDAEMSFTAYLRDITERKKAEEERELLLERERAARSEAEAANRSKDDFLSILSHELRTPLTPMLGWVELLLSGKLNHEMSQEALQAILRNIRSQIHLVEDLLDISRIVTGKPELKYSDLELEPVVMEAIATLRPAADSKNIEIRTVVQPGSGHITGDPHRLQQVIWNLLSNAIKFTPAGGWVEISLTQDDSVARIQVRDNGQGIGADFLPCVFDRLRQEDTSPTRRHGGLGIGLSIVQHLVELHGGTVQAESPGLGQGAIFTVSLPLKHALSVYADPRHE